MENKKASLVAIILIALVGTSIYFFGRTDVSSPAPEEQISQNGGQTTPPVSPLVIQGNIISVSPERLEITAGAATNATEKAPNGASKAVEINPATIIEKATLQDNENGQRNILFLGLGNISDLKVGQLVIVSYKSEKESALQGVDRITVLVEEDI